jgi:ATP-dependent Lhr-like helicase
MSKRDALIVAPTGTGKTLAAFLFGVDALVRLAEQSALPDETRILYITPLKALGNDIALNLERPLSGIRARFEAQGVSLPMINTAIRHGDTLSSARAAMLRKPPHILITTPESLFLLLTGSNGARMLSTIDTVIVDELHAILATKRGASLSLSLERLASICTKPPQRIGLSATIALPGIGAAFLSGADACGAPRPCVEVIAQTDKRADIFVESPRPLPEENSVWPQLLRETYQAAKSHSSTLVFVNGRATAERMAAGLCALADADASTAERSIEKQPFALTHHGSLSKEARLTAERLFKQGQLKCLCATGSMELGIDVGEIDLVIQVGSVPTIANGLQRLGRAGHSPDRVSVMRVLAKTACEALDAALSAQEMLMKRVEPERPPEGCLDVLSQHCLSMVWREMKSVDELLTLARGAWGYRALSRDTLIDVLRMLSGDYERGVLQSVRPRLYYDAVNERASGDAYTRMLACAASTIPDRGLFPVYLEDGGVRLGELDEECVFEARVGDRYMLGASAWQIVRIERDRVVVRAATREGAQIPFWKGEGIGRSYAVGKRMGERIRALEDDAGVKSIMRALPVDEAAAKNIATLIREQIDAVGALATDRRIVIERFKTEAGYDALMLHSVFGGRAHTALSMLLRAALERETGAQTLLFHNDQGILFLLVGAQTLPGAPISLINKYYNNILDGDFIPCVAEQDCAAPSTRGEDPSALNRRLADALTELLPPTPLFSLIFRQAAARAMIFGARSGRRQPLWIQRERGARALDIALNNPDHPLLQETLRECLTEHMDVAALADILSGTRTGRIAVAEAHTQKPSPMASDLMMQFAGFEMYDYAPSPASATGVRLKVGATVEAALFAQRPPDRAALEEAAPKPKVENADALHAWLLTGGDALAEELPAHDAPPEIWLEELLRQGRAAYIEPGLWIAMEHAEDYREALTISPDIYERANDGAFMRIVARRLRFRGGMSAGQLEGLYARPVDETLSSLVAAGDIVLYQQLYWHAESYRIAGARTRAALRSSVVTAKPAAYAALLAARQLPPPGPSRLDQALIPLSGFALPSERWEREILPARIPRYRPAMLDALLATGRFVWRAHPNGSIDAPPAISFEKAKYEELTRDMADISTKNAAEHLREAPLSEQETLVFGALAGHGAMFSAALTIALGFETRDALLSLMRRGLVANDSFAPVRALLTQHPHSRQKLLAQSGRWSTVPTIDQKSIDELLMTAFARWAIICKETAAIEGLPWSDALDRLRVWEYTGKARRGYFVRGLSGAQFVLDEEFLSVTAALAAPHNDRVVLAANDPAQAWGRILSHEPEKRFILLEGTAVVLRAGVAELIAERHGEQLRWEGDASEALAAFVRAYRAERIYLQKKRLKVKQFPEGGGATLAESGFQKEGDIYTLWKIE